MCRRAADSEDLRALLDEVDDDTLDRILEAGASIDEITEAVRLARHVGPSAAIPSSSRVAKVHRILFAYRDSTGRQRGARRSGAQ